MTDWKPGDRAIVDLVGDDLHGQEVFLGSREIFPGDGPGGWIKAWSYALEAGGDSQTTRLGRMDIPKLMDESNLKRPQSCPTVVSREFKPGDRVIWTDCESEKTEVEVVRMGNSPKVVFVKEFPGTDKAYECAALKCDLVPIPIPTLEQNVARIAAERKAICDEAGYTIGRRHFMPGDVAYYKGAPCVLEERDANEGSKPHWRTSIGPIYEYALTREPQPVDDPPPPYTDILGREVKPPGISPEEWRSVAGMYRPNDPEFATETYRLLAEKYNPDFARAIFLVRKTKREPPPREPTVHDVLEGIARWQQAKPDEREAFVHIRGYSVRVKAKLDKDDPKSVKFANFMVPDHADNVARILEESCK